jgi:serine O-acetyltransferase
MKTSLDQAALAAYLGRQLEAFFPDGRSHDVGRVTRRALERVERCFERVVLRFYRDGDQTVFNHLHSDQYATFLYFASNTAFREAQDLDLASKIYGLNKALNGLMCMYDTELPEQFLIIHTVGMMLGKARYADYFVAVHNAVIGTDRGITPRLGEGMIIYGGAAVIGDCDIGPRVSIAARATVRNQSIPGGHVVAGTSPDLIIKPSGRPLIREFFDTP